jgi:hypothetical protein
VSIPQVTQATNDKQPIVPMLERLAALPDAFLPPKQLTADTGFFSEANVVACDRASIEPLIAIKREEHHPHWSERFANPPPPPPDATPLERMVHRLKSPNGRATDALRKQTVEPVFSVIKAVMGFRQFLTCGLDHVRNEWTLVLLGASRIAR